jgi:glycerate dehydrogenase
MNVVFLDRDTISPRTRLRSPSFAHEWREYGSTDAGQVAARIAGADIVITNKVPISAAALERAARVKFVAVAATGNDIVDVGACKSRGITVSNIRDYAVHTVPEHTLNYQHLIRNPMLTKPKRFQFVQEAAAQILDSAML